MQPFFDRLPIPPFLKKYLPYLLFFIAVGAILFFAWMGSSGEKQTSSQSPTGLEGFTYTDPTGTLVGAFFKLVLVFALIFLTFAGFRWWQLKKPGITQKRLKVLETIRMTPRQSIHLIKVDSHEFLVGATDHSMNLISSIPTDPCVLESASEEDQKAPGFEQVLLNTIKNASSSALDIGRDGQGADPVNTGVVA
jgi:flagellar biogenesis protein FliO